MITAGDLSELTVGDVYAQCIRTGVDPEQTLVGVFAGFENAPNLLDRLFRINLESIKDRAEVA